MKYVIADGHLADIQRKAEKVGRKCKALGLPFVFEVQDETAIEGRSDDGSKVLYPAHWVEVEGVAKINGWTFVAKIEHTETGNLLMCAPDMSCPERYRTAEPICEHCGTRHWRKETFVVVNGDGEYRQVGRNCLALYTGGLDASVCVEMSLLAQDCETGNVVGSGFEYGFRLEHMVASCLYHIGQIGYDRDRLCALVEDALCSCRIKGNVPAVKCYEEMFKAKADEIVATAKNLEEVSDYLANVKVVFSSEVVPFKRLFLVASYVYRFVKDEMKAKATAKKALSSSHVGEVGQRVEFKVKVVDGQAFRVLYTKEHYYGYNGCSTTYVVEFVDVDGNVFVWSASNTLDICEAVDDGATELTLVGTVKAHSEYKGVKQTVVQRVKVKA